MRSWYLVVHSRATTIECDTGLATSYEGSSGCRGPTCTVGSGIDTVPDECFHLDIGACPDGQVGVWHSDAVIQPGPRDGHGRTLEYTASSRVDRGAYKAERKRHVLRMPCRSVTEPYQT